MNLADVFWSKINRQDAAPGRLGNFNLINAICVWTITESKLLALKWP